MAYILGYFAADGAMIRNNRGAHFIEFHSTDKYLIELVRSALKSEHRVGVRRADQKNKNWKIVYRLQIGSIIMYQDLQKHRFVQNKSKTLALPVIPPEYAADFVRGYFDGDGNVYFKKLWVRGRKRKKWIFSSRFTCGCKEYLVDLHTLLKGYGIRKGFIVEKSNQMGFELVLSHRDSLALFQLMYNTALDTGFYLPRKYKTFHKAISTLYPTRV
jgi:hypothetical protein